jgi:ribonuclease HII
MRQAVQADDIESELRDEGFELLAGVDEAGRGALAGPLVAAAVILPPGARLEGVRDSKQMTPTQREKACGLILERALCWAWSCVSPGEIDSLGLQEANMRALREAAEGLQTTPQLVVVDWFTISGLELPQRSFTHGDALLPCISAASVLAKVTRDRIMRHLHQLYPGYGFDEHKGYGTARHLEALRDRGPCPLHRRSFQPVSQTRMDI